MAATNHLLPLPGDVDGLGKTSHPWEELHVRTIKGAANSPALLGVSKQVWISARTDTPPDGGIITGVGGTGLQYDPFDGSTQPKLDAIFQHYYDANTTDITFNLASGVYYLIGGWDLEWSLLSGWKIKGAGMDHTRIVQVVGEAGVDAYSGWSWLFGRNGAVSDTRDNNESIEDMHIDLAYFRSGPGGDDSRPHGDFCAVNLHGSDCSIRNVRVTGAGWADNECFVLWINGGTGGTNLPHNAIITGCEVFGEGINQTALTITNQAGVGATPTYARNGRFLNNTVDGVGIALGPPGGFDSGLVMGNIVTDSSTGFFEDTFCHRNIIVTGNSFEADVGIFGSYGGTSNEHANLQIRNNLFRITGPEIASGINFTSYPLTDCTISNNTFVSADGDPHYWLVLSDYDETISGILVQDNTVDPLLTYGSLGDETPQVSFIKNVNPSGARAITDNPASRGIFLADCSDRGSDQSIADVTTADWDFGNISSDTAGLISIAANTITAPSVGEIEIEFAIILATATAAGRIYFGVTRNAGAMEKVTQIQSPVAGTTYRFRYTTVTAASDAFRISIRNETGSAMTISRVASHTYISGDYTRS